MPLHINPAAAPLYIVTASGDIPLVEMERYLEALDQIFATGNQMAMVAIAEKMGKIDRRILKTHADWFQKHTRMLQQQWLGLAFYIGSPVIRFFLSSFLLLGSFPMPYTTTSDFEAAVVWAVDILRKHGLKPSAPITR
jgi:hypothetical protein